MEEDRGDQREPVPGDGEPVEAAPPAGQPPAASQAATPWQATPWQPAPSQPPIWQPPIPWDAEAAGPAIPGSYPAQYPPQYGGAAWAPPGSYPAPSTFVPARKLASIATVLLAISGVIALVRSVTYIYGVDLQGRLNTARALQSDADFFNRVVGILALASLAAAVVCAIAFMRWLWRSLGNAVELGSGYGISSPRMAVVAWFIPLYNLVRPYQIVIELHDRLLAPLGSTSGRRVIKTWWVLWILGSVVGEIAVLSFTPSRTSTAGVDRLGTMAILAVTSALSVADAILAIAVVRQLQRLADARELARRGQPDPAIELVTRSQRARVTRVPALLAVAAIVVVTVPLGVVYGSASATPAWIQYQPSDKSFSVSMPVTPLEKPIAPKVQSGLVVSGDVFQSGEKGTLAFVITYYDYPKGTISTVPTQALDSMQSALGGAMNSTSDRTVSGRPGRQFQATITGTTVRMIACIDGDRAYVVEADYTSAEANSPDIDRFLNSFALP